MSYFLFDGNLEIGQYDHLSGEEAQHLLHSRRIKKDEMIELQDHQKRHFRVVVEEISRHKLFFRVKEELPAINPSSLNLEVIVGLPKEKALDWIIQKVAELGVARLLIFIAHYSPRTISSRTKKHVLRRWDKIAQEACKQSGRQIPPEILLFKNLTELLATLSSCHQQWVLSTIPSSNAISPDELLHLSPSSPAIQRILVGPEGGLHPEELEMAYEYGMQGIHLGPRILRSETAVIAMASILQFLFGDLRAHERGID